MGFPTTRPRNHCSALPGRYSLRTAPLL